MANYSKSTDFAAKDALPTGNAGKIVKGTEIDDEFVAIQTSIASKAELAGSSSQSFSANNLTVAGDASVTGDVSCATLNSQVINGNVIAWAAFATDGTLNAGSGLTVEKTPSTNGTYAITLDTAQADQYSYAASASTALDPYSGEIDTYTASTFRVRTYNGTTLTSTPTRVLVVG